MAKQVGEEIQATLPIELQNVINKQNQVSDFATPEPSTQKYSTGAIVAFSLAGLAVVTAAVLIIRKVIKNKNK